jgi:hypothetical protein
MCLIFNKFFHTGEFDCFTGIKHTGVSFTYFSLTISYQSPFSFSSIHHHLHNRLTFISLKSLIPKSPFFLLLQILDHLTRWYFFLRLPPCQKNPSHLIHSPYVCFRNHKHRHMIHHGIREASIYQNGFPPLNRDPPCHTSNFSLASHFDPIRHMQSARGNRHPQIS